MTESPPSTSEATRRAVMLGAGGVGLVAVLGACGGSEQRSQNAAAGEEPVIGATSSGPGDGSGGEERSGASTGFATTADIPEGGGRVFKEQKVVVTQPAAGEFKAFEIACTHRGCEVDDVSGGTINCPCHGSRFSIADGSVQGGPASSPLPEVTITVDGDSIALA
ncbi:Rieske (2Fe-2S) protein [Thermostaphylospora chromogena]|uniref:Rieske (2Fe-2S) protein n=1 Tax=Thermostaphylospora chromogena TaxID=35622 RepID=UPI0013F5ADC1|nr:Rieske (2Fe-2S) protein [Thermostaphylospora chromogena]